MAQAFQAKAHREQLILEQAHQVFAESWRLLIGVSEGSGLSLFKASARVLSGSENEMTFNLNKAGRCVVKTVYQVQKNILRLSNVSCQGGVPRYEPASILTWDSSTQLSLVAWPAQFPTSVGDSVSILNPKLECQMKVQLGKVESTVKLVAMKCQGLSQSIGRSQHVAYKEFNYSTEADQLLTVQADKYENLVQRLLCESNEPCLQLHVPRTGKIGVLEDRRKNVISGSSDPSTVRPANREGLVPTEDSLPGATGNSSPPGQSFGDGVSNSTGMQERRGLTPQQTQAVRAEAAKAEAAVKKMAPQTAPQSAQPNVIPEAQEASSDDNFNKIQVQPIPGEAQQNGSENTVPGNFPATTLDPAPVR